MTVRRPEARPGAMGVLVEPERPFLGTVRLDALPYRNVDISQFYPYGDVSFP
jgi:hypothetical protein